MPEPLVEAVGGTMSLTFFFAAAYLSAMQNAEKSRESNGQESEVFDGLEMWGEKWGERWGDAVTQRRIAIVRALGKNPTISIPKLADAVGLGTTAIENHLRFLQEIGAIERVGPAKGGYWRVVDSDV